MQNLIHLISKPDNVAISGMLFAVLFYFWYAMRQAINNDKLASEGRKESDKVNVWPYLVRIEFVGAIILTSILVLWSIGIDAPLESIADPSKTPNPSKAPWYFLGLQEMLVYFDPWIAGVVLPSLIIFGLMAVPYIDPNPQGNGYYTFKERKFAIVTFAFGFIVLWVFMVIIGTFLRGPGWNIFMPWQKWDSHKIVAITNINLSEFFWNKVSCQNFQSSFLWGYKNRAITFFVWGRGCVFVLFFGSFNIYVY